VARGLWSFGRPPPPILGAGGAGGWVFLPLAPQAWDLLRFAGGAFLAPNDRRLSGAVGPPVLPGAEARVPRL
jgi:hypothetical protein